MIFYLHKKRKTQTIVYKKNKNHWHKRLFVIKYNYERVIKMNFLKNNKGAILFYAIIILSTLMIINDVEKDNLREENHYVMTYLSN